MEHENKKSAGAQAASLSARTAPQSEHPAQAQNDERRAGTQAAPHTETAAAAPQASAQTLRAPGGRGPAFGYTVAAGVLGGVLAAGLLLCLFAPSALNYLLYPLLGGVCAAFLWCFVARVCFCRAPERYLTKPFRNCLKLTLVMPVWFACTVGLTALPVRAEAINAELVELLMLLEGLAGVCLMPAALACAVLGLLAGVQHLRAVPEGAGALYREGPFALSLLLLVAMVGGAVFLVLYFVL